MNNTYINPHLILTSGHAIQGQVTYKSPSNIALVKYWGKRPTQIPQNPSISFTLDEAHTVTSIEYTSRSGQEEWLSFYFEGKKEASFAGRIEKYLMSLLPVFPFLEQLHLVIKSRNSFPHSSGIASSASGMSAIALCLCEMERRLFNTLDDTADFLEKASYVARLGSGSACRSLYPGLAVWGKYAHLNRSSDYFAIPYDDVQPSFLTFHDDVLIISADKKSVSSTVGHSLMESNPFAQVRYQQAHHNLTELISAMRKGDYEHFGKIVEDEALMLHALMMCSDPSFILMKPATLTCINEIRTFREESHIPVYFTLDAGPNIHVLYPHEYRDRVAAFIKEKLIPLTEAEVVIRDHVGMGPEKIES